MNATTAGATSRTTIERMDEAWAAFRERLRALPAEHLERHIGDEGWTRKQMLAHIAAWHDLPVDRLVQFVDTGEPGADPEEEDVVNARAARGAVGRTTGEVVLAMEESYRRLSREVARLTDAQMAAHGDWASAIIAGNTFDHYTEHLDDLRASHT
jgi:DinB superfamily